MKIAFTGHRPDKLYGYDKRNSDNQNLIKFLTEKIEKIIVDEIALDGTDTQIEFISGMALGIDMWLADAVIKLRRKYPNVTLHCAIPCLNHSSRWNMGDKMAWEKLVEKADKVHYVSEKPYTKSCMQTRNVYMVDEADKIFAVWDGTSGGTKNCIDYAKKKNKPILVTNPITKEESEINVV